MKAVYDQIRTSSSSVEVLLNRNAGTFMRWALAALQRHQEIPVETADELLDQLEDASGEPVELAYSRRHHRGWTTGGRSPSTRPSTSPTSSTA